MTPSSGPELTHMLHTQDNEWCDEYVPLGVPQAPQNRYNNWSPNLPHSTLPMVLLNLHPYKLHHQPQTLI